MFNTHEVAVPITVAPSTKAKVYVDGRYVGEAPLTVNLSSAASHTIDIEADGYARQSTRVESRTSGGYVALDCVLLIFFIVPGVIALAVDASGGHWNVLQEQQLSLQLASTAPAAPAPVAPAPRTSPPAPTQPAPPASTPSEDVASGTGARGCQYDAQCKGTRICLASQCTEPTAAPESTATSP